MSEKTNSYKPGDISSGKLNFFHKPPFAIAVLVVGLLVTITAWYLSNYYLHQQAVARFNHRTAEIQELIMIRLNDYKQAFKGGVALFNSSNFVSREEWKRYIKTLDLQKNYPGIHAIGFSFLIPEGHIDSLEHQVQLDGFEDFNVYPSDTVTEDHAIIYIEPFDRRNKSALGYNMYSEEKRREAMARARDSAIYALTEKVDLIQETEQGIQKGFLLYFPVYKRDHDSLYTVEERRRNLYGFVYGIFSVQDFMEGLLSDRTKKINFAIYDDTTTTSENLLFQNNNDSQISQEPAEFSSTKIIEIGDHTWTIIFNSKESLISKFDYIQPLLIAFAGIVLELILFYLIWSAYSLNKYYRRVKTEAEENANSLHIALSAANMGIWELDLRKQNSRRSLEHDKIFGYNKLQPKWNYEIFISHILPEHRIMVGKAFEKAYETGKLKFECQLDPSKLKSEKWIYVEGKVTYNFSNKPVRIYGIVMDISERKKVEEVLKEKQLMLESSNQDLNTFIYSISHDIKNPLTALTLHSQLAEEYTTIEEYRSFMEMVNRKSEKIQEIIDVMSNVIKEENKDKNIETIDIENEINEVLSDYKEITSDINANIHLDLRVSEIRYIRGYIKSILLNLIGNAIKYRDNEKQLNINISTSTAGEFILLTIKDNGIGIDLQEEGDKLFKPFQRVKSNISGSGLGLFIIKRMIQKNGGKIKVESSPGEGTTFLCYIREY
jgi:CHASE1-domain containing sensor protein/nitrogen-specific signal transduction histidine kinase